MRVASEGLKIAGPRRSRRRPGERGAAALGMALGLVLIMTVMGLAFLVYARRQSSLVGLDQDSAMALNAAEAGFERARRDIEATWRAYLAARTNKAEHQLFWFKCTNVDPNLCTPALTGSTLYTQPQSVPFPQINSLGQYSVAVTYDYTDVGTGTGDYVNAIITVTGRAGAPEKEKVVEAVVRFQVAPSQIFNYAYFINNRADIDIGSGARINGHVRANGNINVVSGYINGEVIAGVNSDIGSGNGKPGEGCVENPTITYDSPGTVSPPTGYRGLAPGSKRPAKPGT